MEINVLYSDSTEIAFLSRRKEIGHDPIEIPEDIANAKAVKSHLCVVISGTPISPYKLEYNGDPEPTIDNPTAMHFHTISLAIEPSHHGEIIDGRNGKVLATFDPTMIN